MSKKIKCKLNYNVMSLHLLWKGKIEKKTQKKPKLNDHAEGWNCWTLMTADVSKLLQTLWKRHYHYLIGTYAFP